VAASTAPTLRVEKRLLRAGHERVGCIDEVGRGALGGPATVGVVVVDGAVRRPLAGVRDSKLLRPAARHDLVPRIERWAAASAVGHAGAAEVDEYGIVGALRLAAHRALAALPTDVDVVLLDGSHDWLTPPAAAGLFDPDAVVAGPTPPVVTLIKADLTCAGVAAASVLAKCARDALMIDLARRHPEYGWDENKGYASPTHLDALRRLGPCDEHRRSWNLPTAVGSLR
jgi:ribonuclease HII